MVGNRPLGPLRLEETPEGLAYQIEALDVAYVRDLLPAVRSGLYGTSIRFEPIRFDRSRQAGIEARTVIEAELMEISLVAFPQYAGTAATLRSTDVEGVTVAELDELIAAVEAYLG